MNVHRQIVAEERCHRKAAIGLVGTGIDILHQVIGNQARVVVALAIKVATNSLP